MRRLPVILLFAWCCAAAAAEVIPPKPAQYFNDYAHVTRADTAARLNQTLEQSERDTSSQIVVAVFPKMESDSAMEDYTVRVFRAWGVGQTNKNNGAVLFVFVAEHKLRIATGYGLEGALPDALCKEIIDNEITPRFKAGDYDGGLSAGVTAMIAATKGEYKGTGTTVADGIRNVGSGINSFLHEIFILVLILAVIFVVVMRAWNIASGAGWLISSSLMGEWTNDNRSRWSGSGSFGGGFFGGGGGGGFSGGGGSTGGGGASGSW